MRLFPSLADRETSPRKNTIGSLDKGAFAYLTKPYNSLELKTVLRRAVSIKGLAVRAEHVEQALHARRTISYAGRIGHRRHCARDQEGLIMWWNGAAERMFGYTKQEALGFPSHPGDAGTVSLQSPERHHEARTGRIARAHRQDH